MSKQQRQAYEFFNKHALEWHKEATTTSYSTIDDRHRAVIATLEKLSPRSTVLDVGCGTGQLAIEAGSRGHKVVGVDFAEEMIEIAKQNGLTANKSINFLCASIFDFQPEVQFDLISAQGFIEYISAKEFIRFLSFLQKNTKAGGAIAIGSRNRLFNLVTLNDYTRMERDLGTVDKLLKETILISNSSNQREMIGKLRSTKDSLVTPEVHPDTGIGVKTRFQFTPSELIRQIEQQDFTVTTVYPINYHAFSPIASRDTKLKSIRDAIATSMSEEFQTQHSLLPFSSSFVIEAFHN